MKNPEKLVVKYSDLAEGWAIYADDTWSLGFSFESKEKACAVAYGIQNEIFRNGMPVIRVETLDNGVRS